MIHDKIETSKKLIWNLAILFLHRIFRFIYVGSRRILVSPKLFPRIHSGDAKA